MPRCCCLVKKYYSKTLACLFFQKFIFKNPLVVILTFIYLNLSLADNTLVGTFAVTINITARDPTVDQTVVDHTTVDRNDQRSKRQLIES